MKNPNRSELLKGSQINWNQVYYFSQVAECGSIKDAAARLELSPSTLSEHVSALEESLRVQLFRRQHRKIELTPEGMRLHLHAKEMFEAGQRLIDVVSPIPLGSYPVSIGIVPTPSIHLAYRFVGDYQEKYGPLGMKLFHAGYAPLEEGLLRAKFDFGFSDRIPERRNIRHAVISSTYIKFYVALKLADRSLAEVLQTLPLLVSNAEPGTRTVTEQLLADSELTPASVVTSDYPGALLDLCQRGLGVGVFSEASIERFNRETLRSLRVPKDAPKIQDNLYAVWAEDAENTEAVKHLRKLLGATDGTA